MEDKVIAIQSMIREIRGQRVILDFDLAKLYQVETRVLNQAVKRNISRFPIDFMFQLTEDEALSILKSQIVMSSWGGRRSTPFAFTEQGVAMLSSVLRSEIAIAANIAIMRAFVQVRQFIYTTESLSLELKELKARIDLIQSKQEEDSSELQNLYEAIKVLAERLEERKQTPRKRIGFEGGEI